MKITKAFLIALMLCFGNGVFADYLFWMLDDKSYEIYMQEDITTATYLVYDKNNNIIATGQADAHPSIFMSDRQYAFNWDNKWNKLGYTFAVELVNSEKKTWLSSTITYKDILASGAIRNLSVLNVKYFHGFNNFQQHIPEPNLIFLLSIGLCVFILRRNTR